MANSIRWAVQLLAFGLGLYNDQQVRERGYRRPSGSLLGEFETMLRLVAIEVDWNFLRNQAKPGLENSQLANHSQYNV